MKRSAPPHSVASRLGVLADEMRLRMLRLLEREELSVGEVAGIVQLPQSTVSRHLKALAEAGWVLKRQDGTASLYRLVNDDLPPELRAVWVPIRGQMLQEFDLAETDADDRRLAQVLAERKTDSRAFFGRVAGEWQHHRTTLFGSGFTAPALLDLLDPSWVAADLGCGSGDASRYLAPCVERVIAIDQSEAMIEAAGGLLSDHPNVQLCCGDLESLPIESGTVDVAAMSLVLHHLASPVAALAEARRILRTDRGGGVLLVVDMLAHDRDEYKRTMGHLHLGFEPETIETMLTDAGFTRASCRVLPTSSKTKGPGLFVATGRLTT